MNRIIIYIVLYLVVMNLMTFLLFREDKQRSKGRGWRISESTLFTFCMFGGSIGGILGMRVFHHKTKHLRFSLGVPVILIIQAGIIIFALMKFVNA